MSTFGKPRGILNLKAGEKKFQLSRHLPAQDLRFFIERYWIVRWDLRGQEPYVQETLPYPCVNVVFEQDATRVYGVETGKFFRVLEGKGHVFGIKFKPGAFYPFVKTPISRLTNSTMSFSDAFGVPCTRLEEAILSQEHEGAMVEIAETFLRERLPERDEHVRAINQIVDVIIAHRDITKVDDLVDRLHLNKRAVQRLFQQYVGVSPKWVIKRYRLHEVAEQLSRGDMTDWTTLAGDLGYFDQAHFIKDFKALVGKTPAEYVKQLG